MTMSLPAPGPEPAGLSRRAPAPPDAELVARAHRGDSLAFELVMRRHNRRLFRLARGLVWDDAEAEDVLQESYVRAYARLGDLADGQALAAWLARIVANEALGRRSSAARVVSLEEHRARGRGDDGEGGDAAAAAGEPASDTSPARSGWPRAASCAGCSRRPSTRCRTSSAPCSCCARSRG
jgi:DNA-directed RNA polymerase specialized sigma24 family protein